MTFTYVTGLPPVLERYSLSLQAGHVTTLTGRSGSGKSTLLNLLGLLLAPVTGDIVIDDVKTGGLSDRERSAVRGRHIGLLFQDALLDPARTVMDNIGEGALYAGLAPSVVSGRARELLARVDLDPQLLARRLPAAVSGGQAQRIALARCLIKRPSVVLADEPTGNLDLATSEVVLGVLRDEAERGATVIVATHDEAVVAQADTVVLLDA